MEHEFERNARTAEAEQSKRAASRVKPTEPDRAGKQSAQRSVGDVERELRGIDEAVKSRTSEGRAEQEAHQRAYKLILYKNFLIFYMKIDKNK